MATEKFANNAATTLSGAISDTALSLVVTSATGFPTSGQFRIKVGNEIILVSGVSGTTYTVTRGQEGTTAVPHGDGTVVTHILTAGALAQLQGDTFTAGGDLSGTGTSQTVAKIQGTALDPAMSGASPNDVLTWDGTKWTHLPVQTTANLLPHLPILAGVEVETLNGWMTIGSISFNPAEYDYTQVALEVLLSTSNATHAAKARLWNITTNAQIGTDLSSTSLTTERLTQGITLTSGLNIYEVQIQTTSSGTEAICCGARLNLSGGIGVARSPLTLVPITADTTRAAGANELILVGTLTTAITITFPASPTTGQTIKIKDSGGTAGTYNIMVSGNGKLIDGFPTFLIDQRLGAFEFIYNGTAWVVI